MLEAKKLRYNFKLTDINFVVKEGSTSALVGDDSSDR